LYRLWKVVRMWITFYTVFFVNCCNSKTEVRQATVISCDSLRYIGMLWMSLIFNKPTENRI